MSILKFSAEELTNGLQKLVNIRFWARSFSEASQHNMLSKEFVGDQTLHSCVNQPSQLLQLAMNGGIIFLYGLPHMHYVRQVTLQTKLSGDSAEITLVR
jgi:hypothetical protein